MNTWQFTRGVNGRDEQAVARLLRTLADCIGKHEMSGMVSKVDAEHYLWGQQCHGWHLHKGSDLSVIQEHVPVGGAETRHYHQRAQQFFFVLSGIATLEVGGETLTLSPGQGRHVAAGVPHLLRNSGPEALEFLVVSVPMAHGDRVTVPEEGQPGEPADAGKRRG